MWAEVEFQIVLRDLTTILDFHSVWYLVHPRLKLERINFGLTGPIAQPSFGPHDHLP